MDIQKIQNDTLAKLTAEEIGDLDLLNHGVITYRGQLKSRCRGYETLKVSDKETHFISEAGWGVAEFIEIVSDGEEKHYAFRVREAGTDKYEEMVMPLAGLQFFRKR